MKLKIILNDETHRNIMLGLSFHLIICYKAVTVTPSLDEYKILHQFFQHVAMVSKIIEHTCNCIVHGQLLNHFSNKFT